MFEYKLPDVGEGLTEAEIVSWKVQVGDSVEINDVIVEIETAKSLVELPSPHAGTVLALLVDEGEEVQVGTPIIAIGDASETPTADAAPGSDAGANAEASGQPDAPTPQGDAGSRAPLNTDEIDLSNPAASGGGEGESLVGRMKADRGPARRPRKGSASPSTESAAATQMQVQGAFSPGGAQSQAVVEADEPAVPATTPAAPSAPESDTATRRPLAKPPVRKLAKDLGVDLATISPSGADGVITRENVEEAADRPAMPDRYDDLGRPGVAAMSGAQETREPIKGVRKMMAQAMVDSAFTAPHVTEWITVDVTRTMEFVERLRNHRDFRGLKVSPLLLLARACVLAMRRTPVVNSFWDETAQEVVLKGHVNLGIAAATPRGLMVPNVKNADAMSLRELAVALDELIAVAKEGRTQPAEMADGTFTITNVGVFGVDAGTPIINPGESAILAFGAVNRRPWVVGSGADERVEIRDVTTLALSFDHRHVDGEAGSRFLADVASLLEDPAHALLF